MKMMDIYCTK